AAHCDGEYSAVDHAFHQIDCKAPVGVGVITLKGDMGLPGSHNYGLTLAAENVPASAAALLARRVKKNLPDDLAASGTVQGSVEIREDAAKDSRVRWAGKGEIAEFGLSSTENHAELGPETIPFVLAGGDGVTAKRVAHRGWLKMRVGDGRVGDGVQIEVGPFWWGMVRAGSPMIHGRLTRSGYSAAVTGDADIAKSLRLARMFGIPALQTAAEGTAGVDLQVAGAWGYGPESGFVGPQVTGTAKLRNVRVALRGTTGPVEISSAELQLLTSEVKVDKLAASAADTAWTGSLEMPRGCGTPGACEVHFSLHANKVALSALSVWARPGAKSRPWYRVLESSPQSMPSFVASLHASGNVSAGHLQIQKFAATQVSADVDLDHGKLRMTNLSAEWLGGKHRGEWVADFSVSPSMCSGSGTLEGASLAGLENAAWITGTAGGAYQVKGPCSAEFWQEGEGVAQFDVRDGALPHLALAENEAGVKIERLWGRARLVGGQFEMKDVWLNSPAGKFQLSGTAGLSREVEVKMTREAGLSGYAISGTLGEPRVTTFPSAEQARLKQ
ncbi:MAG: AsmA-like C-terminal region-containing protein, partial [Candidatus Sulfotelmatobacter sp.]